MAGRDSDVVAETVKVFYSDGVDATGQANGYQITSPLSAYLYVCLGFSNENPSGVTWTNSDGSTTNRPAGTGYSSTFILDRRPA